MIMCSKNATLITFMLCLLFVLCRPNNAEAKDCPYCNGRGYTVKNTDIAGYGLSKSKTKCNICGEWVWEHTAHQHVPCKHCNQTGKIASQSSNGISSYGNAGRAEDRLNAIAQDNPRAYASAMSIKYGSPMSDAEYEEYRKISSDAASYYMKLRDLLEGALIHFNQSTALMYFKSDSPQRITNYMNELGMQVERIVPQLNGKLTQSLVNYLENLRNKVDQSGNQYYNATVSFYQLNNIQNSLDNYLLQMNSF